MASVTDRDRFRAATKRAVAAMQAHQRRPVEILVQSAPLCFPSRPDGVTMPYLRPGFDEAVRARLLAGERAT